VIGGHRDRVKCARGAGQRRTGQDARVSRHARPSGHPDASHAPTPIQEVSVENKGFSTYKYFR
jgi:hypothetical protein